MTNSEFQNWRLWMGWNKTFTAEMLGLSPRTIDLYEAGKRYEDARPVCIPRTVELACAALSRGVRSYVGPSSHVASETPATPMH